MMETYKCTDPNGFAVFLNKYDGDNGVLYNVYKDGIGFDKGYISNTPIVAMSKLAHDLCVEAPHEYAKMQKRDRDTIQSYESSKSILY